MQERKGKPGKKKNDSTTTDTQASPQIFETNVIKDAQNNPKKGFLIKETDLVYDDLDDSLALQTSTFHIAANANVDAANPDHSSDSDSDDGHRIQMVNLDPVPEPDDY